MSDIKNVIRASKEQEVDTLLEKNIKSMESEGYSIEFGKIGTHTTWALATHRETQEEIVGYTFIRDMKYYRENVGKLKALQQAIARKQAAESKES